jgi:hypothetical protein
VLLSRVGDGTGADDEFLWWASARYPAFYPIVNVRGDWIGRVRTTIGPAPDVACREWFELHFLANGREAFCCVDSDGRFGNGSAGSRHVIHEIYNHPERNAAGRNCRRAGKCVYPVVVPCCPN